MGKKLWVLFAALLLLAGCGGSGTAGVSKAEEAALSARAEYLAITSCAATVDMVADYGERVYTYRASVSWEQGGAMVLTVLEPENIAGLTARLEDGESYLDYDGASLETGELSGTGLTPLEAVPAVLEALRSGYMAQCDFESGEDGEQLWILCRSPENPAGSGTEIALWLDGETHDLTRAEVSSDGYVVMQCTFTEFTKE
ncbi:MAG: hypothetical protein LUE91_06415 [Oscillospiraceae bacterium]|nr:hypothetical protein [Oscillospiraceae bacterium]